MTIFNVFSLLGGLALFLFGMDIMGKALEKQAGGQLQKILSKLTDSPLKGFFLGLCVTAIIQSSSATTVMVVGFVNSGIMELHQAIGVIMGSNVGTTVTSWILSLSGLQGDSVLIKMLKPTSFSPLLAFIGILLYMCKSEKKKGVGTILIGFAVLMTGMEPTGESNVHGSFVYGIASTATEEQIESVYAFLRAQLPVESPYLTEEGGYSEGALRGKTLFEEVGCAVCHPAPLYTDMQMRKSPYLGADGSWENRAFVTPTLVEIWRSAPYTYAGCETDVTNVVKRFANRELTDAEAKDLAEFVLSIGTVEEYYGIEQTFGSKDGESIQSKLTAGLTLKSFTLRKQLPTDRQATVKAKLVDAAGKVLEEKSFDAGKMSYDAVKSFEWGLKVPSDFQKGGYLLFEIVDSRGNWLATPLKLSCRE